MNNFQLFCICSKDFFLKKNEVMKKVNKICKKYVSLGLMILFFGILVNFIVLLFLQVCDLIYENIN